MKRIIRDASALRAHPARLAALGPSRDCSSGDRPVGGRGVVVRVQGGGCSSLRALSSVEKLSCRQAENGAALTCTDQVHGSARAAHASHTRVLVLAGTNSRYAADRADRGEPGETGQGTSGTSGGFRGILQGDPLDTCREVEPRPDTFRTNEGLLRKYI